MKVPIVTRRPSSPTIVAVGALLALLAGACSANEPTVVRSGFPIMPTAAMLALRVGDTASIAMSDAAGTRGTVGWRTTDASVVRVDSASAIGVRVAVRAIGPGQAALVAHAATSDGQRIVTTIPVTVTNAVASIVSR